MMLAGTAQGLSSRFADRDWNRAEQRLCSGTDGTGALFQEQFLGALIQRLLMAVDSLAFVIENDLVKLFDSRQRKHRVHRVACVYTGESVYIRAHRVPQSRCVHTATLCHPVYNAIHSA